MNRLRDFLFVALVCFIAFACKPGVPRDIIQPDDMEDILLDFHVADGMAQNNPAAANNVEYNRTLYRLGVLKKYNVTKAEFDSSMVYYSRHSDKLHEIYKGVAERLSQKALSLGASADDVKRFGTITADGDTANVWLGERSIVLMSCPPYNVYSFTIEADSAYRKGDNMILNFDCNFITQDGVRDGVALLAVKYGNDSIASKNMHFSGTQHQTLEVADTKHLGIKEVKGFFYMNKSNNNQSTTIRVLTLYNIKLIRFHERVVNKPGADKDNSSSPEKDNPNVRNDSVALSQR